MLRRPEPDSSDPDRDAPPAGEPTEERKDSDHPVETRGQAPGGGQHRRTSDNLARSQTSDSTGSYGVTFWLTFANNASLMVASSLLFRYADFVKVLGGTEEYDLGWIVGVGAIGSILMRLAQGVGIDRYGPRTIWLWSVGLYTLSCLAHLGLERADGPAIYAVRVLLAASVAGAFGASITFISRTAPMARTAEVVGTLGTSGFVGMVVGTRLGDIICGASPGRAELDRLFLVSAGLGVAALVFAILATRGQIPPARRRRPHLAWLLRRYHPGMVLLIAVAMGMGVGLPPTFLRPFVATLGIGNIGWFFLVYAATAFLTRIAIRRLPERIGIRPMIYLGMASLVLGMLVYLPVRTEWQLSVPAMLGGVAHAVLFPAVVAGGSGVFPPRHRGVGTTLTLGAFDVGTLIGSPIAGWLLRTAERWQLPEYPTMFVGMAIILTGAAVVYALSRSRSVRGR